MHHFTTCLIFALGVDAIILHSHHYAHLSRRFHGHLHTLDVFPRSSNALNPADSPVHLPTSSFSGQTQARQVKRQVTDRDWARSTGVTSSSTEPGRGVDYLSDTGAAPAVQPAQPMPATESSIEAASASASPPADQISATASHHAGQKRKGHQKGVSKHAGHPKKMTRKTMRF